MSSISKTMSAISTAFSFTGEKVVQNLSEHVKREGLELTDEQLAKLSNIVKSSVEQAFVLTSTSIQKSLE